MKIVPRLLSGEVLKAAKGFPAVVLTGPRRSGKTFFLKHLIKGASYHLLEDPDVIARLRSDPRAFIESLELPVILDEVQNVPEVFNYVRTVIDRNPAKKGQWFLTGSQEAPLMRGVTESMAGRAAVFQLLPFSIEEISKVSMFRGGFPEVIARPGLAADWFRSYIQTYLERDVRAVSSIRDLATFRRFLSLLASRSGQMLNRTDLAAPLGVSIPTISEWISILEITGQIISVPPFFENFGKRQVKSPKIYFVDQGLLCYLLGIDSDAMLMRSPFLGAIFEGFLAAEIVKAQYVRGKRRELYYFRDQQGLEVDFIVPQGNGRLLLLEAKATRTPMPSMALPMQRLAGSMKNYNVRACLVHLASRYGKDMPLAPGIKAVVLSADFVRSIWS